MKTFIALLRGINVGGKTMIKMDYLKAIFEQMGYEKIRTYIQSGNVIFNSSEQDVLKMEKNIEEVLIEKAGFNVSVIIRTPEELKNIIELNPFKNNNLLEGERIYITFLSKKPIVSENSVLEANKATKDEIIMTEREVYILSREGYRNTVYSNGFIEKRLGVPATTRNIETTLKLTSMV